MENPGTWPWLRIKPDVARLVKLTGIVALGLVLTQNLGRSLKADDEAPPEPNAGQEAPLPEPPPPADADSSEPPEPSDESPPPESPSIPAQPRPANPILTEPNFPQIENPLPEIEAKTFPVVILKRSRSSRVYLLNDAGDSRPKVGTILLLKRDTEPVMAFRVLKTYLEKSQFAAKRVRRYGDHRVLSVSDGYTAIEKIADIEPPPPTPQDNADVKELEENPSPENPFPDSPPPEQQSALPPPAPENPEEKETQPESPPPPATEVHEDGVAPEVKKFDAELDTGSSPEPSVQNDETPITDEQAGIEIEEIHPFDRNRQWLTGGLGVIPNYSPSGNMSYFAAGGFRYGFTFSKTPFLNGTTVQDSLCAELGVFFTKFSNFAQLGDAYSLIPLVGTVRYNLQFGSAFALFFYGGLLHNWVVSAVNSQSQMLAALNSTFPALGTGLLFQVGPSWDLRTDLGFDFVGIGLVLRF